MSEFEIYPSVGSADEEVKRDLDHAVSDLTNALGHEENPVEAALIKDLRWRVLTYRSARFGDE